MFKRIFLLPFILFMIGLTSCSNKGVVADNVQDSNEFEDDNEIYTSILEVTIKEEYSSQDAKFTLDSFPDADLSYVANFKNNYSSEGRNELVVVLKNPTKSNLQTNIEKLKNSSLVYDAKTVNIPKLDNIDDKNLLNRCYDRIFNKNVTPYLREILFVSYEKNNDEYPDEFHRFTKEDFPELDIDSIYTSYVSTTGNKYVEGIHISLTDKSLENTLNSFLAVRNNTFIRSVSFGADGYAE